MKRSRVNDIVRQSDEFIQSFGFKLPPFAYWSPQQMKDQRAQISAIIDARLGWDITDFGDENFESMGLVLFTSRNGTLANLRAGTGICYAEKIMISRQDQTAPMHRHITKTEDIINRGGATLAIKMYESDSGGKLDKNAKVTVACDGIAKQLSAGDVLKLPPGHSVTLLPGNWHEFWGEGPVGRFSNIEEDEEPVHLLVSDYDSWLKN